MSTAHGVEKARRKGEKVGSRSWKKLLEDLVGHYAPKQMCCGNTSETERETQHNNNGQAQSSSRSSLPPARPFCPIPWPGLPPFHGMKLKIQASQLRRGKQDGVRRYNGYHSPLAAPSPHTFAPKERLQRPKPFA
ncbi:hypothetical protein ZHAS_00013572 [Anopheles sinensis]|uniref:Uncharacterized protein n=1 Tax=Anopheles sinensis TaxID=74873 RepID=A0A084W5U0_ANOSI|nr:hypothetical protein ZHAS_00013572 [Anopheles sinensis]